MSAMRVAARKGKACGLGKRSTVAPTGASAPTAWRLFHANDHGGEAAQDDETGRTCSAGFQPAL